MDANDVLSVAKEIDPNSPLVEATEAAVKTIADPSILNIVADLELAKELVEEFKAKIAGMHPSVLNVIKALF